MADPRLQPKLDDGSKIAVLGGGPAGSFFSFFLLEAALRMGFELELDIYEARDFSIPGPKGCNMCGGIISESLIQMLSAEGIILPPDVVQRGIDSYKLHMDVGSVTIDTPLQEKRIGAVYRGPGPRDLKEVKWGSFDGHLLGLAADKGARIFQERVTEIQWVNDRPELKTRSNSLQAYDLLAVATGVNSASDRLFANLDLGNQPPRTTRTFIQEYYLGEETIEQVLGSSMHVFLLDIPRLEFAAIIPKGDYASLCLLGDEIDSEMMQSFLDAPEVRRCMPPGWDAAQVSCKCMPRINIKGGMQPTRDRVVFIGDSGVTRLYKDGIGAAYRTAKAAATTAVFQGIAAQDFRKHYWPACQAIEADNRIGKLLFMAARQFQGKGLARRALLSLTAAEQSKVGSDRRMSMILWDMFTGSAPYRDILKRALSPALIISLVREFTRTLFVRRLPGADQLSPTANM